ncbi:MAG: ATP-binding cassette domain-containing protein [Dehalococcoidales bacterium]|nr:ATP-binding cassette domain-containing protein [Dehalococcoidales bacterium]
MDISIQGASEHNLKNVSTHIGDGLTVVTGVSGSGKTSLVFDTLYHEARRRLHDVISTGRPGNRPYELTPAKVESISGLGPAVLVGQNILNRNPGSTLASASGLHPFFRLLFTNYGTRHCRHCGTPLQVRTDDEIIEQLLAQAEKHPVEMYVPLVRNVSGSHRTLLQQLAGQFGKDNLRVDGQEWQHRVLDSLKPHDIEISLGDISPDDSAARVREILNTAAALGVHAITARNEQSEITLTNAPVCTNCGNWFVKLETRYFHMACPYCDGSGCSQCLDSGLHPEAINVQWNGFSLPDLLSKNIHEVQNLFAETELPSSARRLLTEITLRLDALDRVGLGYISLNRSSPTLSRGESQRVRLAVVLANRIEDMLHILDEPTIGQHPADVARLLPAFRDLAGPVVFVEHERIAAAVADRVIDLGPGAGSEGGEIVFTGTPAELWSADTTTGRYFSLESRVAAPAQRRKPDRFISIRSAAMHNLKDIDVDIPVGRLTVVTGVSGSGKSTLVGYVLVPSMEEKKAIGCEDIEGTVFKTVLVDQSPIGKNPRSNPATYTKLSDIIRDLFAQETGLSASHFSFNRPEGACPSCNGSGALEMTMQFLYSSWIPCPDCDGQRFSEEVLAKTVTFGENRLTIADFYRLSISEVTDIFTVETRIPAAKVKTARSILRALIDVGLGYLPLGQPSPSLSGGEAQRVKLSKFLGRKNLGDHLLVMDEPSTGLHPKDLDGLLVVIDRLVRTGATIVIVEHNTDIIRAADWIIDLGPGAGSEGGQVVFSGPPDELINVNGSKTGQALRNEELVVPVNNAAPPQRYTEDCIRIRNARANNLKGIDADIPKGKLTVVTGLSGSGKSSLVGNVLEVEARRRYLESLSMYERQGTREGPEAPVDSITGLGITVAMHGTQTHLWSALTQFTRRASVGKASELSHCLSVLLANVGEHTCLKCGQKMDFDEKWVCPNCHATAPATQPRHFSTETYASACKECTGTGSLLKPKPEKLIIDPEKPICSGAMYSPGYWPQTYLCQDQPYIPALGERYGFDAFATPWNEMSVEAKEAFLYGDETPVTVTYRSKSTGEMKTHSHPWEGFYGGWVSDWDIHGTYTEKVPCPSCNGSGFKPEYLSITLAGYNVHELSEMPLSLLETKLNSLVLPPDTGSMVRTALETGLHRLRFLNKVGLSYLNLNRPSGTLSAGEIQRIQFAGLLGSGLTSLTVLLDEPSRGMHPHELEALTGALLDLRNQDNTVIVIEHDLQIIRAADHIIDMGPGAGTLGGKVVASGTPDDIAAADTVTGKWLRGEEQTVPYTRISGGDRNEWLTVKGARENNLQNVDARIPLHRMTGVCGVSGSGKSTLLIDTLGRALVQKTHTSSFAREPVEPGRHDTVEGAPKRTFIVDQTREGIRSPAVFLGLTTPLLKLYASTQDAAALELDEKQLNSGCTACGGRGITRIDMGFLPDLSEECEICKGTGFTPEAWEVKYKGVALPEVNNLTLEEACELFSDEPRIARTLKVAVEVGLGYLVWRQPAYTMSGGEAQRLRIVKELCRRTNEETLYILDEPSIGQHMEDVTRLIQVLKHLVKAGHSVVIIEHHLHMLAACDWLIELGPGGGLDGGRIIAAGTPEEIACGNTPTSKYLREILEVKP